jgi:hypothetical protein
MVLSVRAFIHMSLFFKDKFLKVHSRRSFVPLLEPDALLLSFIILEEA